MIQDIKFSRTVQSIGRNGIIKQTGISLCTDGVNKTVIIEPINSKGQIAKCFMEIPLEDVPSVIEALEKMLPSPVDTLITNYEQRHPEIAEIKEGFNEFARLVSTLGK